MTIGGPTRRSITITNLAAVLGEMSRGAPCSLAFDGDGTLWSGDVSDDVFWCRQPDELNAVVSRLQDVIAAIRTVSPT